MSSTGQTGGSWQDSARELMEGWNPPSENESLLRPPSRLATVIPSGLEAADSYPAGPTMLFRAFDPSAPGAGERLQGLPGPVSGDCELGLAPVDGSRAASLKSRETGRAAGPGWPRVGSDIGGFRLLLELGRGAFARVYLAEEVNLGRRLVALKVSRAEGDEPRVLARLQHAHIVPVHSVLDEPATGLRLLCMPFFGGANLAQLLQEAWGLTHTQATGRSLVEALDQFSQRLPVAAGQDVSQALGLSGGGSQRSRLPSRTRLRTHAEIRSRTRARSLPAPAAPGQPQSAAIETVKPLPNAAADPPQAHAGRLRGLMNRLVRPGSAVDSMAGDQADDGQPSRQFLRGASGIEAAVWIVARLAEGLDHAHSRGLLHRDLKPANILIAADGTPMLLDFNLAAAAEAAPPAPDAAGTVLETAAGAAGPIVARALLGGTLPYMAPEHLDAIDPEGLTSADAVDERSDLYALGIILFEMISGSHPFPDPPSDLHTVATIRAMIAERSRPAPSLRARCPEVPWSIDALVCQCLDPEPDHRYQAARDLGEDLRRFLDHLPMKHCPEPSLRERLGKWTRRHPGLCGSTSIAIVSLVLLGILTASVALVYDGMLDLAARMKLQAFDRGFIDSQFLLGASSRDPGLLQRGMERAAGLLEDLGIRGDAPPALPQGPDSHASAGTPPEWVRRLRPPEAQRLWRQTVELLILEARGGVVLSARDGSSTARRNALDHAIALLELAERLDREPPSALFADRAGYHAARGETELARRDRDRASRIAPTDCRDLTMLGSSLLASGDLAGAESALRAAIARDTTSLWAWFVMGHCHFEQGRYLEAAGDFSACVARGPEYGWCHFNRALALARAGRLLDAKLSYDRAIELDSDLIEARVDRALVELELDRTADALVDLRAAVTRGRREPAVLAALGESLARLGRHDEAEAMFREFLETSPDDPVVLVARGMSRVPRDPAAAHQDFTAVLQKDPRNALAHYGIARLVRSGEPGAALAHLDAALHSDPNLIDALQLRALVRGRLGNRSVLDDVDSLVQAPTARRLYNAACALALYAGSAGDSRVGDRALDMLELALRGGFPAPAARNDPDLEAIRSRPGFQPLLARFTR